MKRFVLFLKGMCMGIADVIPGVSGGTLALILGVYRELVDTIKGLNPRVLRPLWRWLTGGRSEADLQEVREELRALNLGFLITLGLGIFTALGVGSMIIPTLMENYPVAMRALFFGLIVASVWVPFRMIEFRGPQTTALVVATAIAGFIAGWIATNPGRTFDSATQWAQIESTGETLKDIARRGPSAAPTEMLFWAEQNEPLRRAVQSSDPERFAMLRDMHLGAGEAAVDKAVLKARSEPYDALEVPAGTPVRVPRPTLWFVFVAGAVAICAMILPGISGSYILLILNAYFFILNALKGFLKTLASLEWPSSQAGFVILFCAGAAVGLLSFSRLLSFLLRKYPVPTLGVLVGLMIGCLRGIWPFRETVGGIEQNIWPSAFDATVVSALVTFLVGFLIVVAFTWIGRVKQEAKAVEHEA